jgi:hypothetical protein
MKIFMTLLVRDEDDIIAANLSYHLSRGVDHIIVTDNRSTDGTREILESFVGTGQVTILEEREDDFSQFRWVTRMARLAAEMGADWVINNDADEIWWPLAGDLAAVFEAAPAECGSLVVERTNALPLRVLDGHPFEQMLFRDVQSVNGIGKPLIGKAAHRGKRDVQVEQGNHRALSPSLGPASHAPGMTILHFPYRSYAQFERKISNGGAAYERNAILPESVGSAWRAMYRRLRSGSLHDWYAALPHADDPEVGEWIERGKVVEDRRLANYLQTSGCSCAGGRIDPGDTEGALPDPTQPNETLFGAAWK